MIEGSKNNIKTSFDKSNSSIMRFSNLKKKDKPIIFGDSYGYKTTILNMLSVTHNTNFGRTLASMIGVHEENGLAPADITKGYRNWQWCACTMSYALKHSQDQKELKSNDLGYFTQVSQYINWGQSHTTKDSKGNTVKRYNPISTQNVKASTMKEDRKARVAQIKAQLSNNDPNTKMKEGDLIVWKSDYHVKANQGGKPVTKKLSSSHIGMIERITKDKSGNYYVWVIEGNANEAKSDKNYERYIHEKDSTVGAQTAGEIVEVNKDDGLIRKCYSVDELANFGYSGYINMDGIV